MRKNKKKKKKKKKKRKRKHLFIYLYRSNRAILNHSKGLLHNHLMEEAANMSLVSALPMNKAVEDTMLGLCTLALAVLLWAAIDRSGLVRSLWAVRMESKDDKPSESDVDVKVTPLAPKARSATLKKLDSMDGGLAFRAMKTVEELESWGLTGNEKKVSTTSVGRCECMCFMYVTSVRVYKHTLSCFDWSIC